MESEFLLNLKEISIESIVISILIFTFTMLIKWPIKKTTAKFQENKRKAINTVIIFIPMLLSFIFSLLYFGLFFQIWFEPIVFDTMVSSYIMSLTIYAIFSRILVIIKSSKSSLKDNDLSKETIRYIQQNIVALSKTLKIDEKNLEIILNKIENLLKIRDEINNNILFQNIAQAEKIENQLSTLENKKNELTNSVKNKQIELNNYKNTLKKGE